MSLLAIAQNNPYRLIENGTGFAVALGEKRSKKTLPVDKLTKLMLLARGGELPLFDQDSKKQEGKRGAGDGKKKID